MTLTNCAAWQALTTIAEDFDDFTLRHAFASDETRGQRFTYQIADLTIDLSRHLWDDKIRSLFTSLCEERSVASGVHDMLNGSKINQTENRSVLHTALRRKAHESVIVDGTNVVSEVHAVLAHMRDFALKMRSGKLLGSTGLPLTTVVNIGIGGSDLGPVMAYEALKAYKQDNIDIYFVSNVDGADIVEVLKQCNPATTLFVVASKTFTTSETMTNASTAKDWLSEKLGAQFDSTKHFVALSTNAQRVKEFGISSTNVFGFWDWVGGRFSIDSAIGLSVMIAIGPDRFDDFLDGFHKVDRYLAETELKNHVIAHMACLSLWYRNFFDYQSYAVLPYDNYLKRLPAYLQQLLMESNGKSVTLSADPVAFKTTSRVEHVGTSECLGFWEICRRN